MYHFFFETAVTILIGTSSFDVTNDVAITYLSFVSSSSTNLTQLLGLSWVNKNKFRISRDPTSDSSFYDFRGDMIRRIDSLGIFCWLFINKHYYSNLTIFEEYSNLN